MRARLAEDLRQHRTQFDNLTGSIEGSADFGCDRAFRNGALLRYTTLPPNNTTKYTGWRSDL
jgi:hypothetical protein